MVYIIDKQELKLGLIIFRRSDVKHRRWYCRVKVPDQNRYKTFSLKTESIDIAREKAFEYHTEVRLSLKYNIPLFK